MPEETQALVDEATCFICLSPNTLEGIDTYLLATLADVEADPEALAELAKCFICLPPNILEAIDAYLSAVWAGEGPDPEVLAQDAACYICLSPQVQAGITTYLLGDIAENTDPQSLADHAECFICLNPNIRAGINTYLMVVLAGEVDPEVPTTPEELVEVAKHFVPLNPKIKNAIAVAMVTKRAQTPPCAVPLTPTGLAADTVTSDSVTLIWDAVADADSIVIERRELPVGSFGVVDTISGALTTYEDTTVVADTDYEYRIKASNTCGDSEYTAAIEVNVPTALPAGLLLDYDSREIVGLNDNDPMVSGNSFAWPDSSGRDVRCGPSGASATGPIYRTGQINGLPAVTFGGQTPKHGLFMGFTSWGAGSNVFAGGETGAEMFMVVRIDADPPPGPTDFDGGRAHFGGTGAVNVLPSLDSNLYDGFASTVRRNTGDPATNLTNWHLYNTASTNGEWTSRINGTTFFTTATNTFSTATNVVQTSRTLGWNRDSFQNYYLKGQIARVLLFDHVLSAGDRAIVNQIIANTYGLTIA